MADSYVRSGMAMVNIDGSLVKQLREEKRLTQLYIATAVEVTTDTISRWENKRYPTIKEENAVRLAAALDVPLESILKAPQPSATSPETPQEPITGTSSPAHSKNRLYILKRPYIYLFAVTLAMAIAISATLYLVSSNQPGVIVSAHRFLPLRCTVNQPFPVTITVNGISDNPAALIVREQFPEGVSIIGSVPSLPQSGLDGNTIKWLLKTQGNTSFTYAAVATTPTIAREEFSGVVAASSNATAPVPITGNSRIVIDTFHWADSDGDFTISDQEILAVYDQHGNLESLGIDVDLIEEIWLAKGYLWDSDKQAYQVVKETL